MEGQTACLVLKYSEYKYSKENSFFKHDFNRYKFWENQ